jgi:hypothetical protein
MPRMRVEPAIAIRALPIMFACDALGIGVLLLGHQVAGLVIVALGGLAFLAVCVYLERKRRRSL